MAATLARGGQPVAPGATLKTVASDQHHPPGEPARGHLAAFDDKVAIVTGAASGIGRAIAAALVARGAVVILADINETGAKDVARELQARDGRARAVSLDVTDRDAVDDLVSTTAEDHGRIDFVFNNAGIAAGGPVDQLPIETWDRAIEVDLRSVVHGVRAAYPVMIRQGDGHIVNTASLAGLVPSPVLTPYAAAKHAVVGLSLSLRVEAAVHGVRVSVVCPGPVDTPMLSGPDNRGQSGEDPAAVDGRKLLTNALGAPYAPEALAEDVLHGVAENRALIVAPESARASWGAFRADPDAVLRALSERAVAGHERRSHRDVPGTGQPGQPMTSG